MGQRPLPIGQRTMMTIVVFVGMSIMSLSTYGVVSCQIWTALSSEKIFQGDTPALQADPTLQIRAARNEHEAIQCLLRCPEDTTLLKAAVSDLNGPALFRRDNIRLFQVCYVYLPNHNRYYPDPLPPLKLPLKIPAHQTQPLWISIYVPTNTPAGTYRGLLQLTLATQNGHKIETVELPIALTVWDFTVPIKPTMRTAFGISWPMVAMQHAVGSDSQAFVHLKEQYYEMLVAHRCSPYHLPCDVLTPEADRFLLDPRVTSYIIPYSDDSEELKEILENLSNRGVLKPKGYFYVTDEPTTPQAYARTIEVAERIHGIDPSLKLVCPYNMDPPFAEGKTVYDLLGEHLDILCPISPLVAHHNILLNPYRKRGRELWWYVCSGPFAPYANLHTNRTSMDHRMLFWQQKKLDVTGLLYWHTNAYAEKPNTFVALELTIDHNGRTYSLGEEFSSSDNPNGYWRYTDDGKNLLPAQPRIVGPPVPGWAYATDSIPCLFKTKQPWSDVPAHFVVGHGPFRIIWEVPEDGKVNIAGSGWIAVENDREMHVILRHNQTELLDLPIDRTRADAQHPCRFNNTATLSPAVKKGDQIELQVCAESLPDPWEQLVPRPENKMLYGDGLLIYPGTKHRGLNGPVSSIRLEIIRDGIEDYEYLTLLEKRFGKRQMESFLHRALPKDGFRCLTEYLDDAETLDRLRGSIGEKLNHSFSYEGR